MPGLTRSTTQDQLQSLLPTVFNSHQPRLVALALNFKQRVHLLYFGAVEQEALWQYSFTDSAPVVTAAVNNRITGRTTLAARPHSDPAQ